jgi:hypothetical protein
LVVSGGTLQPAIEMSRPWCDHGRRSQRLAKDSARPVFVFMTGRRSTAVGMRAWTRNGTPFAAISRIHPPQSASLSVMPMRTP